MNAFVKYIFAPVIFFMITAGATSCKKDSYLTDGGVSSAVTALSNYDYLKANKYHYFDTTLLIIDHFNLKDSVNKAGTFFAFTNFSVNALMISLNVNSLAQLYDSISSKLVTQYLFTDTSHTLYNVSTSAVQYANWAGVVAPSAIRKVAASYSVYLTNSAPTFNYYTLQYIKINGVLDGSANAPANDPTDAYLPCQTTGIKTSAGATTLHVLANNASLNKL